MSAHDIPELIDLRPGVTGNVVEKNDDVTVYDMKPAARPSSSGSKSYIPADAEESPFPGTTFAKAQASVATHFKQRRVPKKQIENAGFTAPAPKNLAPVKVTASRSSPQPVPQAALDDPRGSDSLPIDTAVLPMKEIRLALGTTEGNYDLWYAGCKTLKTLKPTEMTIGAILATQETAMRDKLCPTPDSRQSAAVGKYQFMPSTLLARATSPMAVAAGITMATIFTKDVQDFFGELNAHYALTKKPLGKSFTVGHPAVTFVTDPSTVEGAYNRLATEWMVLAIRKDGKFLSRSMTTSGGNKPNLTASKKMWALLTSYALAQLDIRVAGGRSPPRANA